MDFGVLYRYHVKKNYTFFFFLCCVLNQYNFYFSKTTTFLGFASSGYLKIAKPGQSFDTGVAFPYTYNIRSDNKNGKTLQQLSTMAGSIMRKEGGEYFDDFDLFVKYYGQPDYANRWITAAIDKTATNFPSGYVLTRIVLKLMFCVLFV